jgi:hypothetical protein
MLPKLSIDHEIENQKQKQGDDTMDNQIQVDDVDLKKSVVFNLIRQKSNKGTIPWTTRCR